MTLTPLVRVSAVLTLVGVLGIAVAASILRRSVDQLRADRAILEHREELSTKFEQLLRDLQETEAQRAALRARRPPAENLVRFVEGLEATAAQVFIDQQIAAIPSQSDKGGQPYNLSVVRYQVTLQGTAEKIEAYLRTLATLPQLVRVERMELRAPPDGHVIENATAELLLAVAVQGTSP